MSNKNTSTRRNFLRRMIFPFERNPLKRKGGLRRIKSHPKDGHPARFLRRDGGRRKGCAPCRACRWSPCRSFGSHARKFFRVHECPCILFPVRTKKHPTSVPNQRFSGRCMLYLTSNISWRYRKHCIRLQISYGDIGNIVSDSKYLMGNTRNIVSGSKYLMGNTRNIVSGSKILMGDVLQVFNVFKRHKLYHGFFYRIQWMDGMV